MFGGMKSNQTLISNNMPKRKDGSIKYYSLKLLIQHEEGGVYELYYTDIFQHVLLQKLRTFQLADDGTVTIAHVKIYSVIFPSGNIWHVRERKYEYRNNGQTVRQRVHEFQMKVWVSGIPKIWLWQNWLLELALQNIPRVEKVTQKLLAKRR